MVNKMNTEPTCLNALTPHLCIAGNPKDNNNRYTKCIGITCEQYNIDQKERFKYDNKR